MDKIKIWNDEPSAKQLDEIASRLEEGELVVIPTDTLYGITCDALNPKAIDKLCRLKGINPDKTNLSIICTDIAMASEYARFNNSDYRLLKENVPGAFTFLFKTASTLPKAFKGRKTVGVRIPDCNLARLLAGRLGHPLLTTSIEYEDEDYGTNPDLIAEAYEGKASMMVIGEEGNLVASTIVDCLGDEPIIVREGKGELR